jgi:hypothetical protein
VSGTIQHSRGGGVRDKGLGRAKKLRRGLIAVTAGIAIAAGLAVWGTWLGGLVGAAIAGTGIYLAPEIPARLARRRDTTRSARERLDRVSADPAAPVRLGEAGPAALLRADRRVVEFIGRPELDQLREWCDGENQSQVLLLTGAGGTGKTRLALELARERQADGWTCRVVRDGGRAEVVAAARALTAGPVLLTIDYAESRLGLPGLLRAATGDDAGRLKILLIARSKGEWWEQLQASTDASARALAIGAAELALLAAPAAGDLLQAAVGAFAGALGVPVPEQIEVVVPPGPVPILVVHAAALLAVLDCQDRPPAGPVRVVADRDVLDDLLARERAFWLGAARAVQLAGPDGIDSVIAAQAVAVACLFAVTDEGQAQQVLGRVPALADVSGGRRRKIARWLRQLYPPDMPDLPAAAPGWWGSLQPDLLAERHVAGQLSADHDLAAGCLHDLSNDQARKALTILARACVHDRRAAGVLASALRADLATLGVPAVETAVQTGGPLGQILAGVLSTTAAPLELLIAIEQAIPHPTLVLAAADTLVTERIVSSLPDDTSPAERARWADVLSVRLSQAGRTEEALPPAERAAATYRELAAADPARYRPELAAALANLGVRLTSLGQPANAVAAAAEAVTIRRELAQDDPGRYLPDLAISLSNLAASYSELGRRADALTAAQEAADTARQLTQDDPGRYRPDLAATLVNLAAMYSKLGRADEARSCAHEAAAMFSELARAYPDRFLPDLAIALTDLGALLADLGSPADALAPSGQAAALYTQLAQVNPDRYLLELANALTNHGTLLSELRHHGEALTQSEAAAAILRDLAARQPNARPYLASALSNLGIALAALGRDTDALIPAQEASSIYRDLAATSPDRYRPELATTLANLGIRLASLGRRQEALTASREAVAINRELATQHPGLYRSNLAASLDDLALHYSALGQAPAALTVTQEAVRTNRELADADSRRYQPRLANSLTYHGTILAQLGRTTAAAAAAGEAVRLYEELTQTDPHRYQPERAAALTNLASGLAALGQADTALPFAQEAVAIYQQAARQNPGRFRPFLAAALENLARSLTLLDRTADAAAARTQAAALRGT